MAAAEKQRDEKAAEADKAVAKVAGSMEYSIDSIEPSIKHLMDCGRAEDSADESRAKRG